MLHHSLLLCMLNFVSSGLFLMFWGVQTNPVCRLQSSYLWHSFISNPTKVGIPMKVNLLILLLLTFATTGVYLQL